MAVFFNIPLANQPQLLDIQQWLRGKLPANAVFNDPSTFHITLVYVPDGDMETVQQVQVPNNLPIFGLGASLIDAFDTPEGYAVHLRVEPSPTLNYLQSALFYAVKAMGMDVGSHSIPNAYKPHITLATVNEYPDLYSDFFPLHFTVTEFAATMDDYQVAQRYQLAASYADGNPVSEMGITREMFTWQFSGSVPDVPISPDIDMGTLQAEDDDPLFVTLPAFQIERPSVNRNVISREMGQNLLQQVTADKITGIMGHLDDDERASKYPVPDVYWVGAEMVDDLGWVKGYVPPGEKRDMLRAMKRVNSKVALSIYGPSSKTWDSKQGAWVLSEMELEQIDFAPPKRSGYGLAMVPHITAEMIDAQPENNPSEEPKPMEITNDLKRQIIREMAADKETLAILPDSVRGAIVDAVPQVQIVREMAQVLSVEESNLLTVVKEMAVQLDRQREASIEQAVVAEIAKQVMPDAHISDDEDDPVVAARAFVREMVTMPEDADAAADAVQTALESPTVKTILKQMVKNASGRKLERRFQVDTPIQLEDSPEARVAAKSEFGIE